MSAEDAPHGLYTVSGNLKEEAQVKAALEKSNFDLKMKVFYLEEKLQRLLAASGVEGGAGKVLGDEGSVVNSLRLQLEEKNIELEQRNVLLTKAKNAIESLKKELERNKGEQGRFLEMEDRVRRLKLANDEMDAEYKAQLAELEQQLSASRSTVHSKEQQRVTLQNQVDSLELSLAQVEERCDLARVEKDKIEERWVHINHKAEEMEEELTQLRAHCELYKLQVGEHAEEYEAMRVQWVDSQHRISALEADIKHKLDEQHAHHNAATATLKERHLADLEKERFNLLAAVQEAKETALVEAAREKAAYDVQLREQRAHDAKEVVNERNQYNARIDDLMKRLDDKQEEIRKLHEEERKLRAQHEHDRTRFEHAAMGAEVAKVESKVAGEHIDELKRLLEEANEELKHLRKTHEHGMEVKEGLRREQIDKGALQTKLDTTLDALERTREVLHGKEIQLLHNDAEIRRLHEQLEELKPRLHNQEELVRENERSKAESHSLKIELNQANDKISHVSRDLAAAHGDLDHNKRTITQMESEIRKLQDMYEALASHKDELHSTLHADRTKYITESALLVEQQKMFESKVAEQKIVYEQALQEHKAHMSHFVESHKDHADGFISEHRELIDALRQEIAHLNTDKLEHETVRGTLIREKTLLEKELSESNEKMATLKDDLSRVLSAVIKALAGWDDTLTTVLEGDLQYLMMATVTPGGATKLGGGGGGVGGRAGFASPHTPFSSSSATRRDRDRLMEPHAFVHLHDSHVTRIDDLMQDVAVATDRVQIKVDRAAKLRLVFDAQAKRMLETTQAVLDVNLDRVSLLSHKHNESALKLDVIKSTLDRDQRLRAKEEADMTAFKRDVTASHAQQLRDTEERIAETRASVVKLEMEKAAIEAQLVGQLREAREALASAVASSAAELAALAARHEAELKDVQARLDGEKKELQVRLEAEKKDVRVSLEGEKREMQARLETEVKQLREAVASLSSQAEELRQELQSLNATEAMAAELGNRVHDLFETNRLLVPQLEDRTKQLEEILQERSSLRAQVEALQRQLEALAANSDKALDDCRRKNTKLIAEVERLSKMQMNPSLAAAVLESQAVLQHQQHDGGGGSVSSGSPGPSPTGQRLSKSSLDDGGSKYSALTSMLLGTDYRELYSSSKDGVAASGGGGGMGSSREESSMSASVSGAGSGRHVNFAAQSPVVSSSSSSSSYRQSTPAMPRRDAGMSYLSSPSPAPSPLSTFKLGTTPGGTAATPNTLARTSVSRLSKLGSDLEQLAKKLDQFDVRR